MLYTDRSVTQKAFQVILWEHPNLNSPLWDTGKVLGQNTSIQYAGPELHSGHSYYWKVRWWDYKGEMVESEEVGHFMTGILDPTDWTPAKWLAAPDDITTAPIFTKTFEVQSSSVASAVLCITGLSFVRPSVNDVDLNARMDPPIALSPGWTEYEIRIPYVVYNITDLGKSSNELKLEAMVGIGWRNRSNYPLNDWIILEKPDLIPRVLRAILTIETSNNKTISYYSDNTWGCKNSYITSDSIWNGEVLNGKLSNEKVGAVFAANVTGGPNGNIMYTATMPYIAELGYEKPVKIYPRKDSSGAIISQIVDFGNNSAGVCNINVKGITNMISIHHAEVPQHQPFGPMDGSLFYANLHSARAMDNFTSDGQMTTYQPSLTYHGFRYAEVTGYDRTLTADDIKKVLIHSNVQQNSNFTSSSKLINNIQSNVVRGMLSNLMSVPTDCDQRSERRGWMGDAGLSAETFILNFHMEDFFENFLVLIVDSMVWDTIPDIVPYYKPRKGRPGDPSWSAAFPEIIYQLTKYADMTIVKKFYENMINYLDKMINFITDEPCGIGCYFYEYGDWDPAPEHKKVNNSFTSAFSLLNNMKEAVELANELGKKDDAERIKQIFTDQSKAFDKAFMNGSAQYLDGAQVTYVFPLALGIVPDDIKSDLIKNFLNQVNGPDNAHITCGIVGVRNLFNVLSDLNQHDLALRIAEQTDYPSYGYMIHNDNEPATTIWETWNCDKNLASRNHHMYSSVSGWIQTKMTGLIIPKNTFNFKEVHFYPARVMGISHTSISLQHPKPVHFSWKRNGGVQCAKSAEDQSTVRPNLPKHGGLFLSCGDQDGGTIEQVLFASFGNPTGHCGGYHKLGSCHAPHSMDITKKLCLGKRSCQIPTDVDFWGDPCPSIIKWMAVAVKCHSPGALNLDYKFSTITVDMSVPVGTKGVLHLPAHGKKDIKVREGSDMVYTKENGLKQVEGITSMQWEISTDSLALELESGSYNFKISGSEPERKCIDSRQYNTTAITLSCNDPCSKITTVDWASYGTPFMVNPNDCFSHALGDCHYGSSTFAIENDCIGKHQCTIMVKDSYFGNSHCNGKSSNHLIIEFSCNER